jgi:hypothetical protein
MENAKVENVGKDDSIVSKEERFAALYLHAKLKWFTCPGTCEMSITGPKRQHNIWKHKNKEDKRSHHPISDCHSIVHRLPAHLKKVHKLDKSSRIYDVVCVIQKRV